MLHLYLTPPFIKVIVIKLQKSSYWKAGFGYRNEMLKNTYHSM